MILTRGFPLLSALAGAALLTVGLAWIPTDSPWRAIALLAAGAAAAAAAMGALCRQHVAQQVGQATDESELLRKQALGAASAHAAHVQAILDTATEGIVTIDSRGIVESFNGAAERLFGYAAAAVVGNNVKQLMPQPCHGEHDAYLQRYLTTGEKRIIGYGREVVGRRFDGSLFPIDLSVGEGWTGGKRFFTAVIRDITERHEMQAKLAQTERLAAVGELAAGVAHEVNNPINTMINCAQLIEDGDDPKENSRIIAEEGQRIADIVRDLLQFARDDRDQPQPTSLLGVVERTLRLVGENFNRHGIQLSVELPDAMPPVLARPQQVQQALLNLMMNAKDALATLTDGRAVTLSAGADSGGAWLQVSDNGPGIPEELGSRIFEPFVTTKRARGGTGLGLSVSRSIIEGYGGRIELETAPGQGASFRLWLPLSDHEE